MPSKHADVGMLLATSRVSVDTAASTFDRQANASLMAGERWHMLTARRVNADTSVSAISRQAAGMPTLGGCQADIGMTMIGVQAAYQCWPAVTIVDQMTMVGRADVYPL